MARNKQRTIAKRLTAAVLSFITALSLLPWDGGMTVYAADTSSPIALKRLSGSGEAFIYHSFAETTEFVDGVTYAFLDGKYSADDAVSALGAGAILKAQTKDPTEGSNYGITYYIGTRYKGGKAKVYVQVITPGQDFDNCRYGGLYEVPDSGTPTEYRYFCWAGGARNCGPYYAYTYVQERIQYTNVSAYLNSIEKQGSTNPEDYTVSITYDGSKMTTLDSGSYTVQFSAPNTVTFVISDSVGNSVTANFEGPLAVRYDGNAEGAGSVPATQAVWKGDSVKLSTIAPTRAGYTFVNWKDTAGTTYAAGKSVSPTASLNLSAQWKDSTPPEFTYSPTQVMTGDSDDTVKAAVKAALTITDNESAASDCTVTMTVPTGFTSTPGSKPITVTVADAAGNKTTKTCSVYVASYVSFGTPEVTYTSTAGALKATLKNPGTDTVTESGFVWGVMNSPTLSVNNGTAKTASVVSTAGGVISVTASNLQKGVTYYARAYITAGGITYYSDEISIGLGLPAYGTFTIKNNNNNTFTVTRSNGKEGVQTVYYRTVNGSAVGGTHFTHKYGTLTFDAGVTTQTITVSESSSGANTAYTGKPATAYSNANRTYSVEIYRVTGGGSLGSTTKATRTMTNGTDYKVSRNEYGDDNEQSVTLSDSSKWVSDKSSGGDWDIVFQNNRGKNTNQINFNRQRSIDNPYLKATATGFLYRAIFSYKEDDDGYQLAWVANHAPKSYGPVTISKKTAIPLDNSTFGTAKFTATWETNNGEEAKLWFPDMTGNEIKTITAKNVNCTMETANGSKSILFRADETAYVWFSAAGDGKDKWYMTSFTDFVYVQDTQEPQLVAVAPMAGGTYKVGDTFVVSLIFDEIVDSANSTNISSVKIQTSWGTATYSGGANTNVLYFTGTVVEGSTGDLKVNSIVNPTYIKDMCNSTTTKATASGSGATTATLDTGTPSFTVTSKGITNGTGKATIKVTGTQAKTTGMSYAWSDSTAVPASGWVTLTPTELTTAKSTNGLTLSIRKEAGSGANNGKWYLHVKGEYNTTGYTVYNKAELNFGTAASPASGSTQPTLTVTVDNDKWANSRTIYYSYTPATGTLKYRTPGSTTWTTPTDKTQASFTKNGYYTFLLTAGDVTITKTVEVTKIDRTAPTASIGTLTSDSLETQKSDVYTRLVLPITCADAESGVKTVQYAWTNSTTTPTSGWNTLETGATTVAYTATESTPTAKYLHVKVTDNVGWTKTAYSQAYTVISETAAKNHAPAITLEGAPTAWQNDTATLEWKLTNYSGKDYEVILPDGKTSKDSSGEVWARKNGTYTVTVRDLEYGGENSATVTVDRLDFDPPKVDVSGIKDGWWKDSYAQTMTVTASDGNGSGVGKMLYKIVDSKVIPTEGLTAFTESVTVDREGEYYIYWRVYDNAGADSDEVKREGNYTEGFQPVQIDTTAPEVSIGDYSAETGKMTVTVEDGVSKLKSVSYTITSGTTTKTGSYQVSGLDSKTFDITASQLSPGDNDITVTATDNAGNIKVSEAKKVHVNIISVDITWGALAFTYSDGTWTPKTHDYEGRGWKADEPDGDKITVTNSGDVEVSVTYSYTPEISAVEGSFTDGTDTVTTDKLPTKEKKSVWLCLSGKPSGTLDKEKIGAVTVTIGGE